MCVHSVQTRLRRTTLSATCFSSSLGLDQSPQRPPRDDADHVPQRVVCTTCAQRVHTTCRAGGCLTSSALCLRWRGLAGV